MPETQLKVAQSKAELLAVLRHHKKAVEVVAESHGARNLRVFGPDYGGDEWSVCLLADVDKRVHYGHLDEAFAEIEQLTGYKVVIHPSTIIARAPKDDPICEAVAQ
jgi:hypothetical protein